MKVSFLSSIARSLTSSNNLKNYKNNNIQYSSLNSKKSNHNHAHNHLKSKSKVNSEHSFITSPIITKNKDENNNEQVTFQKTSDQGTKNLQMNQSHTQVRNNTSNLLQDAVSSSTSTLSITPLMKIKNKNHDFGQSQTRKSRQVKMISTANRKID